MSSLLRLLLAFGIILTVSLAFPTFPFVVDDHSMMSTPVPPSQDPFYTAPANFKLAAPGTILRLRTAPGNLTTAVHNSSAGYNILYRTTDSLQQPSWAVTTLFVPTSYSDSTSKDKQAGSSLLSYQIPYDSPNVDSSPSYSLYDGTAGVISDIPGALGRGWFVNVPDYEGPLACFGPGKQAGHATLDSVRAVLSSELGINSNTRYAMWGYSGGSIASEWAAELQPHYAPELKFSGAALGGLIPNVTSALEATSGGFFAGLFPLGLVGFANQYPEVLDWLWENLKPTGPQNRSSFLAVKNGTWADAIEEFHFQNMFDFFIDGSVDLQRSPVKEIFNSDGQMGLHGVPQMPLFIYKAFVDEVAPTNETDVLVHKFCESGVNILYERDTIGGHLAAETNFDSTAFQWLSSVLDGTYSKKYSPHGCTIRDVALNVTSTTGPGDSPL